MRRAAALLLASLMPLMPLLRSAPAPAPAALPPLAGITGGALFGGNWSLVAKEPALGRHLAIVRLYYNLGQRFGGHASQMLASGSTVLVSLDVPAAGPSYKAITAGHYDTQILSFLTALNAAAAADGVKAVYFCFQHEANNPNYKPLGTPADYAAAYAHLHALAAAHRLNWNTGGRVYWVVILMRLTYFTAAQRPSWSLKLGFAADYWPPAGTVDVAAADGYNRGQCTRSANPDYRQPGSVFDSPASLFGPVLTFAGQRNLPVFLAEYASVIYTTPAPQAAFITAMQQYVQGNPRIEAVSYWDTHPAVNSSGVSRAGCDYTVDRQPASLAALAAMGRALTGTVTGP